MTQGHPDGAGRSAGVLAQVLADARRQAPAAVVVFDLDSTLFDNRPRQVRIFREFGQQQGVPELAGARPEHWLSWDLRGPMRLLGLGEDRIEALFPELKIFWRERFFTSEYCVEDLAIAGAPRFVTQIAQTGAQVVYLTGRHEGMRPGTLRALEREGFPPPVEQAARVVMLMKPTLEESDDTFKAEAHARVRALGPVIAAFDNEPLHANDLSRSFPRARVVHLRTNHSGRAIALLPGITAIDDFTEEG